MDAQWPLTQPVKRGTCGLLLGDDDARLRVDVGLDRPLLDGRVHFRHRRCSYVSRTSRCGSAGGSSVCLSDSRRRCSPCQQCPWALHLEARLGRLAASTVRARSAGTAGRSHGLPGIAPAQRARWECGSAQDLCGVGVSSAGRGGARSRSSRLVDVLVLDDDVASSHGLIISPAIWRRFFRPPLEQVIRAAREAAPHLRVFYHSDGDFTRLVPELAVLGVDVVNPVAPDCMDAAAIRRTHGSRPALWGTVGDAWLWDQGTPEEVKAEVARRIDTLGTAGLLLAPSYDLDYAPRENVEAFVEAVLESE